MSLSREVSTSRETLLKTETNSALSRRWCTLATARFNVATTDSLACPFRTGQPLMVAGFTSTIRISESILSISAFRLPTAFIRYHKGLRISVMGVILLLPISVRTSSRLVPMCYVYQLSITMTGRLRQMAGLCSLCTDTNDTQSDYKTEGRAKLEELAHARAGTDKLR